MRCILLKFLNNLVWLFRLWCILIWYPFMFSWALGRRKDSQTGKFDCMAENGYTCISV